MFKINNVYFHISNIYIYYIVQDIAYRFQISASCPSRQVEFARAALEKLLDAPNSGTSFKYVGMVREDKVPEIRSAIESLVYEKWEARRGSSHFFTKYPQSYFDTHIQWFAPFGT